MLGKEELALEESIEEKQSTIESNIREIEQKENLLNNIDVHEFIKEDLSYYEKH